MKCITRNNRLLAVAAGAVAAVSCAAMAPNANALVVTSGPEGLVMREPNNTLNRVTLSLIENNTQYRVEMPQFGGRGITGNCAVQPSSPGVDIVHCQRITPKVDVSLGSQGDSFKVDPSFPDPITIFGSLGGDSIQLGAGDDTADPGAGGGTIAGRGGNDTMRGGNDDDRLLGEEGNDTLLASGDFDKLEGGDGDDTLEVRAGSGTRAELTGGLGLDQFKTNGRASLIDARDGIAEQIDCGRGGLPQFASPKAVVDLVDTPDDAGLLASGCHLIDRAPKNEKTAAQPTQRTLRLSGGSVALRVRCSTRARCRGTAALRVGGRRVSKAYSIAGRTTKSLSMALPMAARQQITRAGITGRVSLTENGVKGKRNTLSAVTVKR